MKALDELKNRIELKRMYYLLKLELKKATFIGRKMLNATRTTTDLNEAYAELGQMVENALKKQEIKWKNKKAMDLIKIIHLYQEELKNAEEQVLALKKSFNSKANGKVNDQVRDNKKEDS